MKRMGWLIGVCCLILSVVPVGADAAALEIAGKSAVLMDVATGTVLYEVNSKAASSEAAFFIN